MNSESLRIAGQLRSAYAGKAWHGPSLRELLADVSQELASARPIPSAHSIWELVLHIELWARLALEAAQGTPMPRLYGTEKDWPDASVGGAPWNEAVGRLFDTGERLAQTIAKFTGARLRDTVPGREYDFYYLFHGVVQHSLYHAGQIAMLSRAQRSHSA